MTIITGKTKEEYKERMLERDEDDERRRTALRAELDRIEQANAAGVLEPYMNRAFVRKYVSKLRYRISHPFSREGERLATISDLYIEICSRPPSTQFMIDFMVTNPPTHQIAQQYGKLLQDRLTFIERVSK